MNVVTHIFFLRRCTVMIVFNSEAIHSYISALHLTIFISYANFVESQAKIRKNGACIQNSEQSTEIWSKKKKLYKTFRSIFNIQKSDRLLPEKESQTYITLYCTRLLFISSVWYIYYTKMYKERLNSVHVLVHSIIIYKRSVQTRNTIYWPIGHD